MEMIVVSSLIIPIIFLIFLDFEIKKLFPIFSLFTISLLRTIPSVNKILSSYNNIKFGTVFLNTYVDDLKILEKIHLKNQDIHSKNYNFNHSIEFQNVQYRYKESEDLILKDINFIIKKKSVSTYCRLEWIWEKYFVKSYLWNAPESIWSNIS